MTQAQERSNSLRFNVAYISVLSVLFVQFGGVVWYASELNSEVVQINSRVTSLEKNLVQETEKTAPLVFEFKHINATLYDLKTDLKEIKSAIEKKTSK